MLVGGRCQKVKIMLGTKQFDYDIVHWSKQSNDKPWFELNNRWQSLDHQVREYWDRPLVSHLQFPNTCGQFVRNYTPFRRGKATWLGALPLYAVVWFLDDTESDEFPERKCHQHLRFEDQREQFEKRRAMWCLFVASIVWYQAGMLYARYKNMVVDADRGAENIVLSSLISVQNIELHCRSISPAYKVDPDTTEDVLYVPITFPFEGGYCNRAHHARYRTISSLSRRKT